MNHRILLAVYNRLWLHTKMTKMEVNVRLIIIGVYIKIAQEFGYWHLQYFSPHTIYAIDKLCGQSIKWSPSDLYKTY